MRKRLARINYGQMRYGKQAGVPREESEATDAIGYGDLPSRLVMADDPNIFNNLDDPSRELTLECLAFQWKPNPVTRCYRFQNPIFYWTKRRRLYPK